MAKKGVGGQMIEFLFEVRKKMKKKIYLEINTNFQDAQRLIESKESLLSH